VLAAALFDFDGTLVDTTEMIFQSMRHATSSVLGRDDFSREELLANVGQPLPRQMEVFDAEKSELLLEAYRAHHEEHHDALIGEFPGVDEALSRLRVAGVGIVQAAKAADLRSVAVSWGAFSEDTLREAAPDHLVPDIDAAVDVLLKLKN
jgi:phosphoglycolate phosphatase-like HAD superfamily hydrolase